MYIGVFRGFYGKKNTRVLYLAKYQYFNKCLFFSKNH